MTIHADTTTTWIAIGSIATSIAAAATFVVALVTRSVANKTKDVAGQTRDLAEETRRLAAATEASVEAMEEPFVIAVPSPPETVKLRDHETQPPQQIHRALGPLPGQSAGGAFVRLRLWNIGSGPAIVDRVSLVGQPEAECLDALTENGGFRPVGAGQVADVEIASSGWPATEGEGHLTISYKHASGRAYVTSSLVVIGDPTVSVFTYARSRVDSEHPKLGVGSSDAFRVEPERPS